MALHITAQSRLRRIMYMSNISTEALTLALAAIRDHASIAVHFHPDRPTAKSTTVAESLLVDGIYRTQFETGLSNGLVDSSTGGPRDEWERVLFGGTYQMPVTEACHRPRYGALDLMRCADGPAIRFGSCFFLLKPEVSSWATFTFGGSQDNPRWKGTVDVLEPLLAALMEESFLKDFALGVHDMRPPQLIKWLKGLGSDPGATKRPMSRNLDYVVEAQVHGEIRLDRDILALVTDPSFKGTSSGRVLQAMTDKSCCELRWYDGFEMKVEDTPSDFRGPGMPSLGAQVALNGAVTANAIGQSVQSLLARPETWKDRGSESEVLQELKLLWHVFVRVGSPDA